MASPIDKLIVRIEADTKQLKQELNKVQGKLKTTGAVGGAAFGAVGGASGALAGSLKKLAGPAAIGAVLIGLKELTAFSLRAGMEFEDLKDSLDTVYGSIEAGDDAFDRVLRFSETTPFQIDTVTKAFISLRSVGIDPTNRMMQVFADAASVAVDQRGAFEAMIRVVQRAKAGALGLQELNMLADRGIDVFSGLKDELGLSRLELTEFGQTAEGAQVITESLVNVLETQFGGAMVAKMDNLSISISNMQIAFKKLGDEIYKSGVGEFFKGLVDDVTTFVNGLATAMARIRGEGLGITLEAPQLTSDMDFQGMQDERARAAKENIQAIQDEIRNLTGIAEDSGGILNKAFTSYVNSPSAQMSVDMLKKLILLTTDAGLSSEEAANLIENLNNQLEVEKENLDNATRSEKEYNAEKIKGLKLKGQDVSAMNLLKKSINDQKGDTETLTHAIKRYDQIFKDNIDYLATEGIETPKQLKLAFEDLQNQQEDNSDTTEKLTVEQQKLNNAFNFVLNKIKSSITETDKYTFANENLKTILEENADAFAVLGITSLPQLKKALEDTKDATEDLEDVLGEELKQAVISSSNAFTTDFVNALLDGQNGLESFKDFARSLVAQIIAIFMQLMVVNKIINSIFNLTGDDALPTRSFSDLNIGGNKTSVSPPPVGGRFAGGGKLNPNKPVIVGERGAEIFVPHANGTLLNNMNSKNAMGGATTVINQSINFATGVVPTVRAEVTKMLPQIAEVTKGAVQESAMRGGSFRRSLVGG